MSTSVNKMDVDEPKRKGELKLNQLKPFTGKREDLKKFLQDINIYLHVNDKVYNDDIKKISFALSFMNDGDAASWKEQLLEEAMKKDPINLGTWSTFEKDLQTAFQPYDAPGDVLEEMKALRMGSGSIEEHNARFKMAITKSELDSTSPAVIDYYRESLNIPLQQQILLLENPPKTLQEWYDWAAKLDNNWRRMQKILGRSRESNKKKNSYDKKKEEPRRKFNFSQRDPNVMDVDALTIEKRDEMIKKSDAKSQDTRVEIAPINRNDIPSADEENGSQRIIYSYLIAYSTDERRRKRRVLPRSQERGFLNWRPASTSDSPIIDVFSVHLATIQSNSLSIPLSITCTEENQTVESLGLIDSRAGGKFIDQNFTKQHKFKIQNSTPRQTNCCTKCGWNGE